MNKAILLVFGACSIMLLAFVLVIYSQKADSVDSPPRFSEADEICKLIAELRYHYPNQSVTLLFNKLLSYGEEAQDVLFWRLKELVRILLGPEIHRLAKERKLNRVFNEEKVICSLLYALGSEHTFVSEFEHFRLYGQVLVHHRSWAYTGEPGHGWAKSDYIREPLRPSTSDFALCFSNDDPLRRTEILREVFALLRSERYADQKISFTPKSVEGKFVMSGLRLLRGETDSIDDFLSFLYTEGKMDVILECVRFICPSLPPEVKQKCFLALRSELWNPNAVAFAIWLNDAKVDAELLKIMAVDEWVSRALISGTIAEIGRTLRERVIAYSDIAGLLRWVVSLTKMK